MSDGSVLELRSDSINRDVEHAVAAVTSFLTKALSNIRIGGRARKLRREELAVNFQTCDSVERTGVRNIGAHGCEIVRRTQGETTVVGY